IGDNLESDILFRIDLLNQFRDGGPPRNAHRLGLQTVDKAAQQIFSYAQKINSEKIKDLSISLQHLLLNSFADRLCRRRSIGSDRALMVGGRGVKLSKDSLVRQSEFFLALDGVESSKNTETTVGMASGIDKALLYEVLGNRIEKKKDLRFDKEKGQFYIREARYFQDLPLEEGGVSIAKATEVAEHLPEVLTEEWDWVLKENQELSDWMSRVSYLARRQNLGEAFTREKRFEAFSMASSGEKDFHVVLKKDLVYFFESLLEPELRDYLREHVPGKIQVPSGSYLKVYYPEDRDPYLEVRIQEVFGWAHTPKILKGQHALTLHLLGPNYRPMQVTSDLTSFWQNAYPEVRSELRLKYPKHSWPEDPLVAKAVAKGRSTKN
ncbi:MAG: ATP-dependent helicase HrpB, partial [Bdellovibrionaceae bacterium]|nr:ATP-dependent helicase HrpB [Pseudobdellovibrionaceae bacterium]